MYGSHLLIQLVRVELECLSLKKKKKGSSMVLTHSQGYRDIWGILEDMALLGEIREQWGMSRLSVKPQ